MVNGVSFTWADGGHSTASAPTGQALHIRSTVCVDPTISPGAVFAALTALPGAYLDRPGRGRPRSGGGSELLRIHVRQVPMTARHKGTKPSHKVAFSLLVNVAASRVNLCPQRE